MMLRRIRDQNRIQSRSCDRTFPGLLKGLGSAMKVQLVTSFSIEQIQDLIEDHLNQEGFTIESGTTIRIGSFGISCYIVPMDQSQPPLPGIE